MKNSKYTKKQILEALKHWKGVLETMTNEAKDDSDVPVISSIGEFLDICKDRGLEVEKKVVDKQGKVVNARLATRDEKIMSREGEEIAKKGCLVIDDGDNTFYAVQPDDISKYYEVDPEGNSATGDNKRWKKIGKRLDYYVTPFDVDIKVSWQDSPLHATAGYSLVCNDKEGKDISPVAPEVFKDKTLWRIVEESCKAKKINEGMTADTAIEEGEIIDDEIRHVVDSMEVLEDWMESDSLQDVLDYSGDNKEVIKRYVQEIEWEHGDIDDGDDTPIAYERYFRELLRAFKFRDEKRLKDWLNSSVDDYFPEQQDETMNEDVGNKDDFNSLLDRIDWHSSSSLGNVYVPLQSIEAAVDLAKHLIGNGTFKAIQNVDDAQKLLDDVALHCGLKTPALCFYDSMTFMRLFKIQKTTTGSFLLKALGSTFREALDASMKK